MRARKDEDGLIGICQQNLLILTLGPRVEPDDGLFSFFYLLDCPAAICSHRDLNLIPKSRDITHCPALFQLAAQLTNDKTLPGIHGKETGLGFDDETLQRLFFYQAPPYTKTPKGWNNCRF